MVGGQWRHTGGENCLHVFLDCFIPFPVEQISKNGSILGLVPCSRVPRQCSEGVLAPPPYYQNTLHVLSPLGFEPGALQPPPTDWAASAPKSAFMPGNSPHRDKNGSWPGFDVGRNVLNVHEKRLHWNWSMWGWSGGGRASEETSDGQVWRVQTDWISNISDGGAW